MNVLKTASTMLVSLALAVSGIAVLSAQSSQSAIPAYAETDLTAKAGLTQPGEPFRTTNDGLLIILDYPKEGMRLKFLDSSGATIKSYPLIASGYPTAISTDSSGSIYAFITKWSGGKTEAEPTTVERSVLMLATDGTVTRKIDLGNVPYAKDDPWYLTDFAVDAKGTIYAGTSKGIEVFNARGKPGRLLTSYRAQGLEVDKEGKLYAAGYSMTGYKNFLEKIDPSNGKQVWRVELSDMPIALRMERKTGTLAVLDSRYVTTFSTDGKQIARIFDMKNSAVNGQYALNASFTMDPAGNIYFIARTPGAAETDPWSFSLYRYTRSTQAAQKTNILTISHAYWFDRYTDVVIKAFEKAHPGWKVEIGRTLEEKDTSSSETMDAVLRGIATELMAGRGADLISLTNLPYRNFIEKGSIARLDPIISADKSFNLSTLRKNIIDASRYRGGLYFLPVGWSGWALFASKNALAAASVSIDDTRWSWKDFFEAGLKVRKDANADGVPDQFALPRLEGMDLFMQEVLPSVMDTFCNEEKKTASFDSPEFLALLKQVKDFAAANAKQNPYNEEAWMGAVHAGSGVFFTIQVGSPATLPMMEAYMGGGIRMLSLPGQGLLGDRARLYQAYGLNQSGRNREMAWELLKLFVSTEMQADANLYSTPINLKAYDALVQKEKKQFTGGDESRMTLGNGTTMFNLSLRTLTDADVTEVDSFLSRIKRPAYSDSRLISIVKAELSAFFSGTRSAEDAVKSLQQKAMMYLQE